MNVDKPATAATSENQGDAPAAETEKGTEDATKPEKTADKTSKPRCLMGVIRVGLFAKRIMLDGDLLGELVVVCAEKPVASLLRRVATLMANEIAVTFHTLRMP